MGATVDEYSDKHSFMSTAGEVGQGRYVMLCILQSKNVHSIYVIFNFKEAV